MNAVELQNLQTSIKQYEEQLSQVESALQVSADDSEKKALGDLKSDLEQLIQLTKENLEAVTKKAEKNDQIPKEGEKTEIDDEYALFMAEMAGTGAFEKNNDEDGDHKVAETQESCAIEDELSSLLGMKCTVHYRNKWGNQSLSSAMVCSLEPVESDTEFQDLQVRVLFTHPTHAEMLPCPYFLDDKCRFGEQKCRYSHGERVSLSSLKDAIEPDYSKLKCGSRVLIRLQPPVGEDMSVVKKSNERYLLWHQAVIAKVDSERNVCTVRLRENIGDKRRHKNETIIVNVEDLFPFDDSYSYHGDTDSSLSDTEYPESKMAANNSPAPKLISERSSMAQWEVHTKGIGSKLMLAMGYVAGQGLGKEGAGRVEPVQAEILPRRVGLCSSLSESTKSKDSGMKVEERLRRLQKKEMERNKKLAENAQERDRRNVFNFLNNTLGDRTQIGNSSNSDNQIAGSSIRNLNVEQFKVAEESRRIEKDIEKLNGSLRRHAEGSAVHRSIASQLSEKRRELNSCRSKEKAISNEQKKRKDKEKLSIF